MGTRSGVDRLDPETTLHNRAADWRRLKMLVLDSVSSPITKRVNNLGLDEFFEWFGSRLVRRTRRLADWARFRSTRITAVRKQAVEVAGNCLLAPELAAGITRIKG